MAALQNDAASMRLSLRLTGQEASAPGAGGPGRYLAGLSVEHFDRRDKEWWPFVRLPAVPVSREALEGLLDGVRDLLAGQVAGFGWRTGEAGPLAVQLGAADGTPGILVEVGVDLGPYLADLSGGQPGSEACLFRFAATRADLVRFADALGAESRDGDPA
jgi:hypothetical protein